MPGSRQNYFSRSSLTPSRIRKDLEELLCYIDVLILVAQNSNNSWFHANILSAMTMVLAISAVEQVFTIEE